MMQVPPSAFPAYPPPPTQDYAWANTLVPPPPIISLAPPVQPEPAQIQPIQPPNPVGESDEEKQKRDGKKKTIAHFTWKMLF